MTSREREDAADVVAVFVGHEDRVERRRLDTQPQQPRFGHADTEAAIDHHAPGTVATVDAVAARGVAAKTGLDDQAIAFAAATERSEPHDGRRTGYFS